MQAPQDRFVQIGDVRTRFWRLGDEGSNLVLIHGFGASVESWFRNIQVLAELHRVYALDLVGHGRSDKPTAPYSPSYFVQFVRDSLDTQHVDLASLVGNSMGGGVTLQFSLQFPENVEKLVLVSGAGLGREVAVVLRLATIPLVGEWLTRPCRRGIIRLLNAIFNDPTLITEEMVDHLYELSVLPGAHEVKLSILRRLCTVSGVRSEVRRPIVENLSDITAPTLIIWGQQDMVLPIAHAHVAQLERPKEFNELVLQFPAA